MVAYDGINNTGNGHDDKATVWKDLSGNGNDGTLNGGATWEEDHLKFDGTDDWVDIGKMNYDNVTLETVVKYNNVSGWQTIMGNLDSGGYGIEFSNSSYINFFTTYLRFKL